MAAIRPWASIITVCGIAKTRYGFSSPNPAWAPKPSQAFMGVFFQESFSKTFLVIFDGDELHRFVFELVRQIIQVGNISDAWATSGGPKFQHHDLAGWPAQRGLGRGLQPCGQLQSRRHLSNIGTVREADGLCIKQAG